MIIGINEGHTLSGKGTGSQGVVKETDKNRPVGKRLKEMLIEKGHIIVNCTVDYSNNDLVDVVNKANNQKLDLFLSIHLNCYDDISANGVETFSSSKQSKGYPYSIKIQEELVKRINWTNRGAKQSMFYVLKNTNAPAVLVELGFCSNKSDMDKFNVEEICKALFKGITGIEYVPNVIIEDKPNINGKTLYYRVICGSYTNKQNAINKQNELKQKGENSFLEAFYK